MGSKNLKIKLSNHSQFQQAWDALIKLGYHWGGNCTVPCTAPYLYTYKDGRILADFFDVEGADLSSPNSAAGYFAESEHEEITFDDLINLAHETSSIHNTVNSESIHNDDNGVLVTHNIWLETPESTVELVSGHYYDIFAGAHNLPIQFQLGAVGEHGVNGVTNESLLAVLIHRTKILNDKFPCDENKSAITYMENALALFNKRTADRQRRGVEGFNKQ